MRIKFLASCSYQINIRIDKTTNISQRSLAISLHEVHLIEIFNKGFNKVLTAIIVLKLLRSEFYDKYYQFRALLN